MDSLVVAVIEERLELLRTASARQEGRCEGSLFAARSNSGERGQEARWLDADDPMQPFNVLSGNEMKSRGAMQDEGDEATRM
jgi:hypothetical protein